MEEPSGIARERNDDDQESPLELGYEGSIDPSRFTSNSIASGSESRKGGQWRGLVRIGKDFDRLPDDIALAFGMIPDQTSDSATSPTKVGEPAGCVRLHLPDDLASFIRDQVLAGGFASANEYILLLIRQERKRAVRRELAGKLSEGLAGESVEMTAEEWRSIEREAIEGLGSEEIRP